jgi:transcriptional regulator with XRE-family HTH domain
MCTRANIRRFREILDMKQETLATELGGDWTQRKVSLLEQKESIEPEILAEVAKVLKVPVAAIESFSAKGATNYFNNYHDQVTNHGAGAFSNTQNNCTFNPLDELLKAVRRTKSYTNSC